jgi:hypothetical protein
MAKEAKMFRSEWLRGISGLVMIVLLAGCSVFMAASGKEEPNLVMMRSGTPRYVVESQLGPPTSESREENGDCRCTYVYEVGNEPSAGRAVLHGALDVLSLGIWEIVGTPMELVQGEKQTATVVYGADQNVKSFWTSSYAAPIGASSLESSGSQYPH